MSRLKKDFLYENLQYFFYKFTVDPEGIKGKGQMGDD